MQHDYSYDPTYGHDLPGLLAIQPPEPCAGFAEFWQETFARTMSVPVNVSLRPSAFSDEAVEVSEIYFDSFEGFRCGGWLCVPRHGQASRGVIVSHGYGGMATPASAIPGRDEVLLCVHGRGFGLSARHDLPGHHAQHVVHGLHSRETYLHRGCVADLWAAVSALLACHPKLEGCIDFRGGSFGGGIGAMALPWDDRIKRAYLRVPSFGHHALRLTLPCNGSGHWLAQAVAREPGLLHEVLAFYDAAAAAHFMRIPVLVAAALFDPGVPPPGQFAVYNAITSPKSLHILEAGHYPWPGLREQTRLLDERIARWFIEGK